MNDDLRAFDHLRNGWGTHDRDGLPSPAPLDDIAEEGARRRRTLAVAYRAFARLGFKEGVAGHITARDPEHPDHFWVAPYGHAFEHVTVSSLVRVDARGEVVEGRGPVNRSAFAIHSRVHAARPDVVAVAHAHAPYGKIFSTLGRQLRPLTQDACAFYESHGIYETYSGVAYDPQEGDRIAAALGNHKAVILANHGHLTVGATVDEAAFWFVTMERSFQVQLYAEQFGDPAEIPADVARRTAEATGNSNVGWFSFQPTYEWVVAHWPIVLE